MQKKRSRALRIVQDLSSTLRSPGGARLKNWSYDPQASRQAFLRMISLHEMPFVVAEYDGFRKFLETLNPMFNLGCRVSARNGCMRDFQQKKLELKRYFQSMSCIFSLTADLWTSNQTLGYISVTCHFIDADWKLQKRIIRFIDVKTPHTGAELFSNKYWNKSYVTLCVPVVLDPRYKLKFLAFIFNESFPEKAERRLAKVERLFRKLFTAYSSQPENEVVASTQLGAVNNEVHGIGNDPWAAWDQQLTIDLEAQVSSELDTYLNENPIPRSNEFDILKWWMGNSSKYPILARMARDVLAIPASSVASESAFSTGGRIIAPFRSSLAPETVEALVCLQDWYRAEGSTQFSMASIHEEVISDDTRRL